MCAGVWYGDVLHLVGELVVVASRELVGRSLDADSRRMYALDERAEIAGMVGSAD